MNPILNKVQERLGGTMHGHYLSTLCPFHDDNNPSFLVYEDFYICLSCDTKGSDLNNLLDHYPKQYKNKCKKPKNPWNKWTRKRSIWGTLKFANEVILEFQRFQRPLKERGFDENDIKKFGLGYLDGWITIPINRKTGVARRLSNKHPKYMSTWGEPTIYNPLRKPVEAIRAVYLAYGIFDAIVLSKLGKTGLAATSGKNINPELLEPYRCPIYIIPDLGEEKEAYKLANELGWRGNVLELNYPEGTKDPNEYYLINKEALRNEVAGSK